MFGDNWFNPWAPGAPTFPPVQDLTGGVPMPPVPAPVANAQVPQAPSMYNRASQDIPSSMGGSSYGSDLAPVQPAAPSGGPAEPSVPGQQNPQQSQLANMLRGVQAPKPPEVQRVSTPAAPHLQKIDPRLALLEFLSTMQRPGQTPTPYSLGHALRG